MSLHAALQGGELDSLLERSGEDPEEIKTYRVPSKLWSYKVGNLSFPSDMYWFCCPTCYKPNKGDGRVVSDPTVYGRNVMHRYLGHCEDCKCLFMMRIKMHRATQFFQIIEVQGTPDGVSEYVGNTVYIATGWTRPIAILISLIATVANFLCPKKQPS